MVVFDSDHTVPLQERWGGWYVTGEHGSMGHLGKADNWVRRRRSVPWLDLRRSVKSSL